MKFKHLLFSGLVLAFMVSCSDDDSNDTGGGEPPVVETNYFPLHTGNTWTYQNTFSNDTTNKTGTEVLTLTDSTAAYSTFDSEVTDSVPGPATGLLSEGTVTKQDGKLLYNGEIDFTDLGVNLGDGIDLSIDLSNIILYDKNAEAGTVLYTKDSTFSEEIVFGQFGTFTIEGAYTVTVTQGTTADVTVGNAIYEEAISSTLSLNNVSITVLGIPGLGDLDLLSTTENEILSSTNYFGNQVGLVKSENLINIPFISLPALPGVPDINPVNASLNQELTTYALQ